MLALYGIGGTALLVTSPTVAPTTGTAQPMYLRTVAPRMAFYPVAQTKPKTPLKNAIKKRSGARTVSIRSRNSVAYLRRTLSLTAVLQYVLSGQVY